MHLKLILLIIFFFTDRLIKYLVLENGKYTLNKGFALGIFGDIGNYYLWIFPFCIIFVFIYLKLTWLKQLDVLSKIAMLSIILGSLSNLLDRIMYNGVIDYISLLSFPVFNIADAMVVIGLLYLLINEYGTKDNKIESRKKGRG